MSAPSRKLGPAGLVAAALLVTVPALGHGFVYDDVLLIQQNPLVHGLGRSLELWHSSYWPAGLLYRPLTLQLFALEWTLGGGQPAVFHLVSLLLLVAIGLLLFRLCRTILAAQAIRSAEAIALGATALFLVHPVHVEAVANVVGQAELLAACFAILAVERYVTWRLGSTGGLSAPQRATLAGFTLLAILSKETGYVVPLLLLAVDSTVLRQRASPARRAEVYLLQGAAVVVGLLLRLLALGSLAGETPATVFRGLGAGSRALAMLAVVPEWFRLLLWPVHLQGEYGPPGLAVTPGLSAAHLLGLALILATVLLIVRAWGRAPLLALGLLWAGIALAPVSNVVAPTGIVLAERTLFLATAGLAFVTAFVLASAARRIETATLRAAAIAMLVLLAGLAGWRSVRRTGVWHDQERFFAALPGDAARSYRAQFVTSRYYYGERRFPEAEAAARRALSLYDRDPQVHEQLGQVLRVQGRCREALSVVGEGVALAPGGTTVRSRLIECALAVGDTALARATALEAVRLGQTEFQATLDRLAR